MSDSANNHSPPSVAGSPLLYGGAIAFLLIMGLLVGLLMLHHRHSIGREARARQEAVKSGPKVLVIQAGLSAPERTLQLQGEARPYATVTLYAKISGYLREVRADKGQHVERDQVLAVIESPEIDRQYQASVADARQKRANAKRQRALQPSGVVSLQDAELGEAQAEVAEATVKQLLAQRGYELLRAPFSGTVTARYADPGALVQSATGAQTGALPVVTVSQGDRLRVYVYLPQSDAAFVRPGDPADILVPERPGHPFRALVSRKSGELDPRTRMMLAELDVPNKAGPSEEELIPGSFVLVVLRIRTPRHVEVPTAALVLRGEKPFIATVTDDDHIRMSPVTLAGDDGITARLLSGVAAGQRIALNLGDGVGEGAHIQPVAPPQQNEKQGAR